MYVAVQWMCSCELIKLNACKLEFFCMVYYSKVQKLILLEFSFSSIGQKISMWPELHIYSDGNHVQQLCSDIPNRHVNFGFGTAKYSSLYLFWFYSQTIVMQFFRRMHHVTGLLCVTSSETNSVMPPKECICWEQCDPLSIWRSNQIPGNAMPRHQNTTTIQPGILQVQGNYIYAVYIVKI